jgi:hypothetical protein
VKPVSTARKRHREYSKSGLWSLKAAVKVLGGRAIDRRTKVGQALEAWREDLIADLGGREALSVQKLALVDVALKTKLLLDSVDVWILGQKSLVNARRKSLLPVVRERALLVSAFQSVLRDLGLERVPGETPRLRDYLRARSGGAFPGATVEVAAGRGNDRSPDPVSGSQEATSGMTGAAKPVLEPSRETSGETKGDGKAGSPAGPGEEGR